jgi:hypothetical protein
MGKPQWTMLLLILILLGFLAMPSQALPAASAPAAETCETWMVSVLWYPDTQGTFELAVSWTSPWYGEVRSWTGFEGYYYYGDIVTDGTRVFWHLSRLAFYLGRFSSPDVMSGRMINRWGEFGVWRAVKVPAVQPGGPSSPGLGLGVPSAP